jgi:DNA-binding SARP family transcriptional activator
MLRYKVTPPALPPCIERPRLLRRVRHARVVVLSAPGGHGKTCFAAQVAAATGGPVAWFRADEMDRDRASVVAQLFTALGTAWPDLEHAAPATLDDETAVALLAATLETTAGRGCLVMDDVHLLPVDVLEAIVAAAIVTLPGDVGLVVNTRGEVPAPLLRAEAMSQSVTLGPAELAFDDDECGRLCGSRARGADVRAHTGGWPLGVALWRQRTAPGSPPGAQLDPSAPLAKLALADLVEPARDVIVALARLPRFPARLFGRLPPTASGLPSFCRRNPWLLTFEGDWWAPKEWLRDSLRELAADSDCVAEVARALGDLDEDELVVQLLVAEGQYEAAAPVVERLASNATRQGRAAWVRALVDTVPAAARTFALDLLAATAAQSLNIVEDTTDEAGSERNLRELVTRAAAAGPGMPLRARALLASHYRMQVDARLFTMCEEALGDALTVEMSKQDLLRRWSPDEVPAGAEMLRLYGYALLFSDSRPAVERGRRLIATALDLLDAVGYPTISQRGWCAYFEVLLFLTSASEALPSIRQAAFRLAEQDHSDAALRLAELATVEYFAYDRAAARRTIEMARDSAARTGNRIALAPLDAIEVALDVLADGFGAHHLDRFDDIAASLAGHPRLAPFHALITAEFGLVLARQGQTNVARRSLERAQAAIGDSFFAHTTALRCRRLRGVLLLAEHRGDDGRAVLDALRRDASAEGRSALVELVAADLGERPMDTATGTARNAMAPPPVTVHVLGPELSVTMGGQAVPTPRGYPAKLLALLVASDGALTVDAAIEGLWPGAHPDVGRNRLHGVILRLRRSLGLPADGPIRCAEGVVRLEASPHLVVDSWEFDRLATDPHPKPDAVAKALAVYGGDVLTVQYAYEDAVESYRRRLRRTFLRLATVVLADPPAALRDEELAALARRSWKIAPDDDGLCVGVVRTLTRLGHRAEARDVLDGTACALSQAGLDGDGFRRRHVALVDPGSS